MGIAKAKPLLSNSHPQGKIPEYNSVTGERCLDYGTLQFSSCSTTRTIVYLVKTLQLPPLASAILIYSQLHIIALVII